MDRMYKKLLPRAFDELHKMASGAMTKKVKKAYGMDGTPGYEPGTVEPEERSIAVVKVSSPEVSAPRPSSPELAEAADKQEIDDDMLEELKRRLMAK